MGEAPDAALEAAKWVEKVRVNPGNYADKKKFEVREYTDEQYAEELERIREHETMCTLPVAVITAAGKQVSEEALGAGADLFLAKPIKLVDLLHPVRTLLRLKD